MNPIYRFTGVAYGDSTSTKRLNPVWSDLSKVSEVENNQCYWRESLDGKLYFVGDDYVWVMDMLAVSFDTKFVVTIEISYDGGKSWSGYWKGQFYGADCEIDLDQRKIRPKMKVVDGYTDLIGSLEKKTDLIKLAPAITQCYLRKRAALQVYGAGESVIGCYIGGMYWEQDAKETTSEEELVDTYHFASADSGQRRTAHVSGASFSGVNGEYTGYGDDTSFHLSKTGDFFLTGLYLYGTVTVSIYRNWSVNPELIFSGTGGSMYDEMTLTGVGAAEGDSCTMKMTKVLVYMRLLLNAPNYGSQPTYPIDKGNDIISDLRNYTRVCPYSEDVIVYSSRMSDEPTEWGINDSGKYYLPPDDDWYYAPIARSAWTNISVWVDPEKVGYLNEGDEQYTLKDSYQLHDVINALLKEFAPSIKFKNTSEYSQFLYGKKVRVDNEKLIITPKSNILAGSYDQPAQKAEITIKDVFDMLKACFRCYWHVETVNGESRLRIEHISYYLNGGSYNGTPEIGRDLTTEVGGRTGKPVSEGQNAVSYDSVQMPERYEFGWMDDCSDVHEGWPINITSRYVKDGNVETVKPQMFTADVDYMLLNPGGCDSDGFAILSAGQYGTHSIPRVNVEEFFFLRNGVRRFVDTQNGKMSFYYLQRYYMYDMPARKITATCIDSKVKGIKKQMEQEVTFPAIEDPDFLKFIKTGIGSGQISKLTVNLSQRSAKATLRFNTDTKL